MKKDLILPCECLGGKRDCGSIHLGLLGDNDVDIWIGKGSKWNKKYGGIYLQKKSIQKMIKWLEQLIK